MEEVREELLRGEDKLLKRILDAWERRYSAHLKDLTERYGEEAAQETVHGNGTEAARDVLRDAVDLKARVKAEFELLQQLRAEIEDSESAFDWKVRFERLEKENLHLREKTEDLKDQVSELERARRSKEFEIKNQQRYYDNRIEDLERQLRRSQAASTPGSSLPPSTPLTPVTNSFSTPTMQKVHQYTALTVISDDEDDFSPTPPPPPPQPTAPTPPPHRSLPAIPLSASSPKPPPRRETSAGVAREEHERVVSALAASQAEVTRLKGELETARAAPELTASLERLREELCLEDSAKAAATTPGETTRRFPEELSFSTLSFANTSCATELTSDRQPIFDLETLAGVIVDASLHNAVSTLRQVEAAVGKERAKAAELADSNRVVQEAQEALERRTQLRQKFLACRQRLWQKVKKDATLRKDIEELEHLIGSAGSGSEDVSASDSLMPAKARRRSLLALPWFRPGRRARDRSTPPPDSAAVVTAQEEDEEERQRARAGSCDNCERLRAEVSEAAMARVGHLARIAELEEESVTWRQDAAEREKAQRAREAELEAHIAKLRQLSVKDNAEIDSLIGELDALRQLLASKQTEFQAQLEAAARGSEQKAEAVRQDARRELERLRKEKEEELQAVMRETFSAQSRASEEVEEEKERLREDHEKALDMLDQKYQDEFVDLERHHTDEVLALKKDLEERFARERSRLAREAEREVAALCEKLAEARAVAESLRQKARLQDQTASDSLRESEQFASQLVEQLIQYFSALEVNLAAVCKDRQLPGSPPKNAFAINCAQQLQPALSESLDALSALVGRVLTALDAAQMAGDALAKRAEKLESELQSSRREADAEQAEADELREGLREQTQELHRAEALIRTYAEKESELTVRLAELDEERTRIAVELEAARAKLAAYLEKEEAMKEEREQLASVRDILSSSMTDSSRASLVDADRLGEEMPRIELLDHLHSAVLENFALFEANQSLQDEKSHLESEFGRRFEALQAHRADLEAQVEALEAELERKEDAHRSEAEDQAAQLESLRKQMRADQRFLEEQTREREAERDHFQTELDSTAGRVRELSKENGALKEQVALLASAASPLSSPGAPPPPLKDPEGEREAERLRERLAELEAELEDVQCAADQFQEQVDELLAENARLTMEAAQRQTSEGEEEEEEEGSADSLEQEVAPSLSRRQAQAPEEERRSKEAEAKLEEAEAELSRMRHVHEELQNDKEELQRQVCQQLSLLSALRQEVDAKRHIVPPTPGANAEMEERVEELDAELLRVNERLSASVHEVDSLRSEISRVTEEKVRLAEEQDSAGLTALSEALLSAKNEEIDALRAQLAAAESRGTSESVTRLCDGASRLRAQLLALTGAEQAEEEGEEEEEEEEEVEEEVRELNIPASDEEGEATEVVLEVKKKKKKTKKRQGARTDAAKEAEARLAEAAELVAVLKLELERRQDEVAAMRVREDTLDREVRSLLAYQSELQEDYDTVQNMLEESQQLKKELEEFDADAFRAEFEEREAVLLRELKEARCVADEREEDLYVAKEEKLRATDVMLEEQLEASLAEAQAENSSQRTQLSELSAQLETQGRELAASLERAEALHRQLEAAPVTSGANSGPEGHSDDASSSSPAREACDATTLTEHDSGLSVSLALPGTPQLLAVEREAEEAGRWRAEAQRWRQTAEEGAQREAEALERLEGRAERAEREKAVERSERERLQTEKDRLQRELDSALREVDCQRSRLHMLLHGAEDELEEALSSLSPASHNEELDTEAEEAELVALHREPDGDVMQLPASPLPARVQALLDRIHKEGVQLLSLSELQFLQTHAAVIRHKLDAVRRRSGLKQRSPDPGLCDEGGPPEAVLGELQSVWRQEKKALQAANESLKDLLTQMNQSDGPLLASEGRPAPLNRNNNSLTQPAAPDSPDWRQHMIDSVVRAYREERQALLAQMRSEVTTVNGGAAPERHVSAQVTPERRLRQLETRFQQSESQQRASLERLYQADRQSLLEETRSLRRHLHVAEQELKEVQTKQAALAASDMNNRHASTLRESEMAGQLEQLQMAFTSLHVDLEAANRRLGESEERALKLSSECQHAARRATDLETELAERESRMVTLADELDREARRRQECMNLADDEKRMLDHWRSQFESEKARAARLEADMKEERGRALDRAREAAAVEQELRCQVEMAHRRVSELEGALESERLRAGSLQRELDAEHTLRRAHNDEAESRLAELGTALDLERARMAELRSQLERDRRQLRQAREAAEEERASRRQAAQVEAEAQAGLASQLESARARGVQLEAALEAERARLRKLTPRAEEVASALERERAAGVRLQSELSAARSARLEADTRAERLQDCLRSLAEEQEAERRRWREQELGLPSNGVSPEPASPSSLGPLLGSLLAAENQLDVLRSLDCEATEDFGSLGRQLRFVRQRLEAASGSRPSPSASAAASASGGAIVRQNCELSRMVVRLAREKEELRAALCRLEEEVSRFRTAAAEAPALLNGHGPVVTPCPSDDSILTNRLYAKYLRSESKRRALVYQKRYLLLLLGGFRECEEAVLVAVASMSGRGSASASGNGLLLPSGSGAHRFRLSRPLMRFRAAARVVVAVQRMRAMVQRWAALTGSSTAAESSNGELVAAPMTPCGRRPHNFTFLTPPTRDAISSSSSSPVGRPGAPARMSPTAWSTASSPAPRPSPSHALSPFQLGVRPLRSSPAARSSPNEEFLHRLERLQRRMENYGPSPHAPRRSPQKLAALPFNYSSVR